jgi:hypothetical protein
VLPAGAGLISFASLPPIHIPQTTSIPCCAYASDECGCKGLNGCAANVFNRASYRWDDNTGERVFDPNGWWQTTDDYREQCPHWKAEP